MRDIWWEHVETLATMTVEIISVQIDFNGQVLKQSNVSFPLNFYCNFSSPLYGRIVFKAW